MLPIDIYLLRHGQSEGNRAKRLSEGGDNTPFSTAFLARHSASFRLTDLGISQAVRAGEWLRGELYSTGQHGFDRFITSEYTRAMETAALLNLPNAEWFCDPFLTERDWGKLDNLPVEERMEKFGEALARRDDEPFFWRPEGGERFLELCMRVYRVLHTLHRECGDKKVIIVCHGEVMWAWRIMMERMSQTRFRELHLSKNPYDRIHNCQILHYSRRHPHTGKLGKYANWMETIRPVDDPIWSSGWTEIERPRYSNQNLLDLVRNTPRLIA